MQNIAALEREQMATISERVEFQKLMLKYEKLQMKVTRDTVNNLIKTYEDMLKASKKLEEASKNNNSHGASVNALNEPQNQPKGSIRDVLNELKQVIGKLGDSLSTEAQMTNKKILEENAINHYKP